MSKITFERFIDIINTPDNLIGNGYDMHVKKCWERNDFISLFRCTGIDLSQMVTDTSEFKRCVESPYYFATKYLLIIDKKGNKHKFTTRLSEDEFNKKFLKLMM